LIEYSERISTLTRTNTLRKQFVQESGTQNRGEKLTLGVNFAWCLLYLKAWWDCMV